MKSEQQKEITKPDSWEEDMREYLNDLRAGGDINMFGAAAPLRVEFGLTKKESYACLQYWMDTFSAEE